MSRGVSVRRCCYPKYKHKKRQFLHWLSGMVHRMCVCSALWCEARLIRIAMWIFWLNFQEVMICSLNGFRSRMKSKASYIVRLI